MSTSGAGPDAGAVGGCWNEPRYTVRRESRRRSSGVPPERTRRVATEQPTKDVMHGDARWEIPVDHGFVASSMPCRGWCRKGRPPTAIVQAARVSYGAGTKKVNEDRGLIRYLLRHRHTTPFEMIEFKFHIAMPIFVARQWIRHRTANVNEYSARYSIVPDRFYRPSIENVRKQSTTNRQGGEESIEVGTAEEFLKLLEDSEALYERYLSLTEKGVAREIARAALPVSVFTEWYWKRNLQLLRLSFEWTSTPNQIRVPPGVSTSPRGSSRLRCSRTAASTRCSSRVRSTPCAPASRCGWWRETPSGGCRSSGSTDRSA